jgi:hypothetical protein
MNLTKFEARLMALEVKPAGRLGRKIVNYDHYGDIAALAEHRAMVRQLEAEGYEVISIERRHVHEGFDGTGIVIERSYGVKS